MRDLRVTKVVNASQLYDELVAAIPALAPTPTGPDGRLEAQLVIEQRGPKTAVVQVPDGVDPAAVDAVLAAHVRRPEVTVDPRGDALAVVARRAADGDELARAVLVLLG